MSNDFKPTHKVIVQMGGDFVFSKGELVMYMFESYYKNSTGCMRWLGYYDVEKLS